MKSSNSEYFSRLDHLRFIAALMVLFWHVMRHDRQVPSADVPSFWPLSFFQEGHTGVALFMVLSGYIFWMLCSTHKLNYLKFVRNRLLRIAPLFLFWTLLYFYIGNIDPSKLFFAVASLLNKGTVPGNGWTIIVEFQFYLLFPFVLIFSRAYGLRYLIALVILSIFIRWTVWFTAGTVQDLAYSTIFGRIDQFLMGMIACEVAKRYIDVFRSRLLFAALVTTWIFIVHAFDGTGGYLDNTGGYPSSSPVWTYWPFLEGLFYAFITASYLHVNIAIPKLLDKNLAWLGALSYSLYLNQHFAIMIAHKAFKSVSWETAGLSSALIFGTFGVFPVLVVLSALTFYLIERPFLLLRTPYLDALPMSEGVSKLQK